MEVVLRKLELEDAERMLQWMQNPDIFRYMQYNPQEQSLERCERFIENSWIDKKNIHFAITDCNNVYMGTVSLKNVDEKNKNAEFAIALHMDAIGTGAAKSALKQILKMAFEKMEMNKVYLYVRTDNVRAIRFYKKNGLNYEGCFREHIYCDGQYRDISWYALRQQDYVAWKEQICAVRG